MNNITLNRGIAVGAVVALFAIGIPVAISISNLLSERDSYKSMADVQAKETKFWQDKEGRAHAQAQAAEANTKAILDVHNAEMKELQKQVKGLNKNLSNLKSYITTGIHTTDTVYTTLRDTVIQDIHQRAFTYQDEWALINGKILNNQLTLSYSVKDSLTFVTYYKKQGWFKDPVLTIDGISYNPHSTITGLKNITVASRKPKRFGVGPYVGFDFIRGASIGIGVQYSVIRF